ncbi:MAG: HD domain-containing phosphohydrolase [Pseudomonadota bacterium]
MDISIAQEFTIQCLASLSETRDTETGSHIFRTQHYVKILSEYLAKHLRFRYFLNDETIEILYKSAPLHDIGKVGIPDRILLKKGKLTEDEYEEMKRHTLIGRNVINKAEERLGKKNSGNIYLNSAKDVAYTHHEKWDGSGYPQGIKGDDIPIPGRLMALADVYDALITERVYKAAFSHEKVIETIVNGKGKHFDPDIVDAFLQLETRFRQIAREFADPVK